MDEILEDFIKESLSLIEELEDLLEEVEDDLSKIGALDKYGQIVDRIMGSAQSIEVAIDLGATNMDQVGQYAQLCKAVGYKSSQIESNPELLIASVAILQDATEMLEELVQGLGQEGEKKREDLMSQTFLDRLRWIDGQFGENVRATVASDSDSGNAQLEIDDILKQMGIG